MPTGLQDLETIAILSGDAEDLGRRMALLWDKTTAAFWEALDAETQGSLLAWATRLTETNCAWSEYRVGQRLIALDAAEDRQIPG